MLLSSPQTRTHKATTPAIVFGVSVLAVLATQREKILSEPLTTLFLLGAVSCCAAWVLWRPWRLPVADQVEERAEMLWIRRGSVEVVLPYSSVLRHEYLRIGSGSGVKLTFKEPNKLGSEIGFYLDEGERPQAVSNDDPIEHMERQFEKHRHGSAG